MDTDCNEFNNEINSDIRNRVKKEIADGRTILGIELGSTRIKAVLTGEDHAPVASGGYDWKNRYEDGIWTYRLDDAWAGLQDAYRKLAEDVQIKYGEQLHRFKAIGFSAMMHGYLVFGESGELLTPFRTWRNTISGKAADELTELFSFNIPMRWSIANLYHAIINEEAHVPHIHTLTTLSGYVHEKLTRRNVIGVGEASGMFPVDSNTGTYDAAMTAKFDEKLAARGIPWRLGDILPGVLFAGEDAGTLTEEGALLLDPTGRLSAGIPLCPPEGDAGTGMVATNSVAERTGNVSAGTSVFLMVVLEQALSKVYTEIDMVTTPVGRPVAMVHGNNCTSDLDAWISVFSEFSELFGFGLSKTELYDKLYNKAMEGDADCGGLLGYNYFAGEPVTGLDAGRPLFVRLPDSEFTLANFMRTQLYAAVATLRIGMDTLFIREKVTLENLLGHGGFFKTKGVGQQIMATAMGVPVSVMETSGEGGAWGIALLAAYMVNKAPGESLDDYLADKVFADSDSSRLEPDPDDAEGFADFMEFYKKGLEIEQAAVKSI
ncbi:MAG: FGGY-family carbohydrate kinase [Clostridiales Family XIII bacterium]|jgi:sugar (pentulose or hexulose) kinase|nr:FGGY-family carbohydrate kinase [Clostridiales Family XIII bacterium]